jgi:hypothetical protein
MPVPWVTDARVFHCRASSIVTTPSLFLSVCVESRRSGHYLSQSQGLGANGLRW